MVVEAETQIQIQMTFFGMKRPQHPFFRVACHIPWDYLMGGSIACGNASAETGGLALGWVTGAEFDLRMQAAEMVHTGKT